MAVLGMQNLLREYQSHSILGSLRWELLRRRHDTVCAVVTIQCAWRCWIARQRIGARRSALVELLRAVQQLTAIVQRVWRGHLGRKRARWMRCFGYPVVVSSRYRRAAIIQALWRGTVGRAYADMVAREKELLDNAVKRIQRVWRGSRVSSWQEIALKQVRRRLQVGRHKRLADGIVAMARQHRRQIAARPDSASDEGSDDDWRAFEEPETGRTRWYSRGRDATADRQPLWRLERQLAANRTQVRIFWPTERRDLPGRVARWVPLKQRFKVEYDDGRVEYLPLHREWKRCTVLWEGVWLSFAALPHEEWSPPGSRREHAGAEPEAAPSRRRERRMSAFALAASVDADFQASRAAADAAAPESAAAAGAAYPVDLAHDWYAEAQQAALQAATPGQQWDSAGVSTAPAGYGYEDGQQWDSAGVSTAPAGYGYEDGQQWDSAGVSTAPAGYGYGDTN
jgi:hypothetical protein